VTVGLRPEHIVIDAAGIPATVVTVEPTGSETQVVMRLGGQTLIVTLRVRVNIKPGDLVPILPDFGQLHCFDEAGQRIN